MNKNECCPEFIFEPWDDKEFTWENKKFIKEKVFTLFYIPINFGQKMVKLMNVLDKTKTQCPDWLCLSHHTSKWNMDIYLAVDKDVPDAENISLTGKFYTKVYEGKYSETGKWSKDFKQRILEKGLKVKRWFMWYTTCPKCAKKYGKNYVVTVGEVA